MKNLPPTPVETLDRAAAIARDCGLQYVYEGNVVSTTAENSYCPSCGKLLIKRSIYTILSNHIKNGRCPYCGKKIYGRF